MKRLTVVAPTKGTETLEFEVPEDWGGTEEDVWKLIHNGKQVSEHHEYERVAGLEFRVDINNMGETG